VLFAAASTPAVAPTSSISASVNKPSSSAIRLTPAEIAQRQKDGKCFRCDELFTNGNGALQVTWAAPDMVTAPPTSLLTALGDIMEEHLAEFDPLFAAPTGLPPPCAREHRIQLLPGTAPVVVRPYRYAQKAELEKQCTEMLLSRIIRPSSSAFSALVLLVKKADD
jgi:hypothetical protein